MILPNTEPTLVLKFGGTSVQSAEAMSRVVNIVGSGVGEYPAIAVLSACSGMTNRLLSLGRVASDSNIDFQQIIDEIRSIAAHHLTICDQLISDEPKKSLAKSSVSTTINEIELLCEGLRLLGECTDQSLDAIAAFGEQLSTRIFNVACLDRGLKSIWFDARSIMQTDNNFLSARVNMPALSSLAESRLIPLLARHDIIITQGFIGCTSNGITTTLGRGGSDLSAALIGAAVGAREIQIWTDVSGILSCDPRLVESAVTIPFISFAEVRELAFYGAKVLHPETIKPAMEARIPVRVVNTFQPEDQGTLITYDEGESASEGIFRAVSIVRSVSRLKLELPVNTHAGDFLREFLNDFSRFGNHTIYFYSCTESYAVVLFMAGSDFDLRALELSLDAVLFELVECSLVACCGVNISSTAIIADIAKVGSKHDALSIVAGISDVSILLAFPNTSADNALRDLHLLSRTLDTSR